ncbi:unnamed protein product [marine sediment metagenome]|uniref:Uncharacterized protein n=1 Tax=marine sediment metagenome TaxID=412755 RepID=X1KQE9_9ZZZZ
MGVDEKVGDVLVNDKIKPMFRDTNELTHEQLTDPDYAIKQIKELNGGKLYIACSKCHHCR